MELVNFMHHYL